MERYIVSCSALSSFLHTEVGGTSLASIASISPESLDRHKMSRESSLACSSVICSILPASSSASRKDRRLMMT